MAKEEEPQAAGVRAAQDLANDLFGKEVGSEEELSSTTVHIAEAKPCEHARHKELKSLKGLLEAPFYSTYI